MRRVGRVKIHQHRSDDNNILINYTIILCEIADERGFRVVLRIFPWTDPVYVYTNVLDRPMDKYLVNYDFMMLQINSTNILL